MWMVLTGTGSAVQAGINVTGATVSNPNTPSAGAAARMSGIVGTLKGVAFKEIEFEAGVSTIALQAYREGAAGSAAVNYPYLGAQVVRWL
jgi:hypothetical protein